MTQAKIAKAARQPSMVAQELGAKRTKISRGHRRYDFPDGSVLQTSGHGASYRTWLGEGDKPCLDL